MNQNQRRYATQRLQEIANRKVTDLTRDFNSDPLNAAPRFIGVKYAENVEILKALVGLPSNAILKPIDVVKTTILSMGATNNQLCHLAYPVNSNETERYNIEVAFLANKRKTQLTDKVILINNECRRLLDSIMLGNEETAIEALNNFEGFSVP